MTYQVSRNGQMYGPYTLDDLKRYLASGNVLPTDLAKSEDMPDWLPVSQILAGPAAVSTDASTPFQSYNDTAASGPVGANPISSGMSGSPNSSYVAPYGTAPAQPYNPAAGAAYPNPPNLHWGLVLLFTILTCGLFIVIWNLIVTAWLRKVQPGSNALFFYIGAYSLVILQVLFVIPSTIHAVTLGLTPHNSPFVSLISVVVWGLRLAARFIERSDLQTHYNTVEPMGLDINPVMVFFFGGLYLQSVLNKVNLIKQTGGYANQLRTY